MKKLILFFAMLFAVVVFNQNTYAQCPEPDACGPWAGPISSTMTYVFNNGMDTCHINYVFCIRENTCTGLHELALSSVSMCEGCDPSIFSQQLIDSVLWAAGTHQKTLDILGTTEIGFCPNGLCFLRVYDRICFNGWTLNSGGCWEMNTCPGSTLGKCNYLIVICYEKDGTRRVIREGGPVGEPCPSPCKSSCD